MFKVIVFILIIKFFLISQVFAVPVAPNCSKILAKVNEVQIKKNSPYTLNIGGTAILKMEILKTKNCNDNEMNFFSREKIIFGVYYSQESKFPVVGDIISAEIRVSGDEWGSGNTLSNVVIEKRPMLLIDIIWAIENLISKIKR